MSGKQFFDILTKGLRMGQIPAKTKAARDWFRQEAQMLGKVNRSAFLKNQSSARTKHTPQKGLEIGSMYVYNYDPKHKLTLPVYDTFPLVFPISIEKDRFLGINLHYLPHKERAQLMDVLYNVTNNKKYDASTKLNISYRILKNIAKAKNYEATIHMYLKKHIKSQLKYIQPMEWDMALHMPLANFKGPQASKYSGH